MKKFIETLKNIWSITELKNKILYTLMVLGVYRLGSYIILPGVSADQLEAKMNSGSSPTDLLGLINSFTGGAFNQGSIFALGVMPYITASIIIQLLGFAVPYFQKLQSQEGESGRKKLNQYTRILTVLITLIQAGTYMSYLKYQDTLTLNHQGLFFVADSIIITAGTLLAMWLGERITDKGIGNGVSLIIMVGIIARLPKSFISEMISQVSSNGPLVFLIEIAVLFFVILAAILIVQGVRKIPIQFAKKMVGRSISGEMPAQGNRDYIPLKVNASGVMPIIFAQAIMFFPLAIAKFAMKDAGQSDFLIQMQNWSSLPYNITFFILVVLFTYIYTALIVNPKNYANYLKNQNSFIPGVKPGEDTEEYIDSLTTRITFPGSIFLALIAIFPAIVKAMGVTDSFAIFFGGTSLLILVGVVLDTLAQVESYLLMRKYDGLIKSGKVKGRTSESGIQIGAGY